MTAAIACLFTLVAPTFTAPSAAPGAPVDEPVLVEKYGLLFDLPDTGNITGGPADQGQVQASWRGTLGEDTLTIELRILPADEFGFSEPTEVADLVRDFWTRMERPFQYHPHRVVNGPFGYTPYAVLQGYGVFDSTLETGAGWVLSGLLPDAGYTVEVGFDAVPTEEQRGMIEAFLETGVSFTGEPRNPEWTDEEVEARIARDMPSSLEDERVRFLRTDHYIVIGNSSGANAFAKNVEECYDAIRGEFPFEEIEGQRLMPIFLFRTRDQYIDYIEEKLGWSRENAARSGGIASGDWYATTYQDPKDPTHLHELTHQIFGNRLLVSGGGSWFQEGVARYMETVEYKQKAGDINNMGKRAAKRALKDGPDEAVAEGEYIRMQKIMTMPSMLYSSSGQTNKGESAAGLAYDQAGSIIYFVMNDKRTRDKAQEFIHRVGGVPRSDIPAIQRELRALFNVDIAGFEEMYFEFWKKGR
ncbi:hypothetical protein [Engelhardtia mirabilis]|uniref:DUF1570 domain-containing protein n=1 Tax=Engelhardtia mirabilis TaxID=2528011 RepID=A0A518BQZ5_9BACT|nr:hypothetical protein Pla133_45130 [Planctomycetes bacterium Pla133]QDV03720.1 hypothetical protein Pla86_45110 [Planctomycetes bacterium Pla86]